MGFASHCFATDTIGGHLLHGLHVRCGTQVAGCGVECTSALVVALIGGALGSHLLVHTQDLSVEGRNLRAVAGDVHGGAELLGEVQESTGEQGALDRELDQIQLAEVCAWNVDLDEELLATEVVQAADGVAELVVLEEVAGALIGVSEATVGQVHLLGAEARDTVDGAALSQTIHLESLDGNTAMEREFAEQMRFQGRQVQHVLAERAVADTSLELLEQFPVVVVASAVDQPGDAQLT